MVSPRRWKSLQWSKVVGAGLVALAVCLLLDPDYPLSKQELERMAAAQTRPSAPVPVRAPKPLAPLGEQSADSLEFAWAWEGPTRAWRIVVLDAALDPVGEMRVGSGSRVPADAALLARLHAGASFHWFVEAADAGGPPRSALAPFVIR